MVRSNKDASSNGSNKSSSKKTHRKSDSTSSSNDENITNSTNDIRGSSVHKQNLYIVSFPIIFLFNILRSLIYQLFCIFRYIYSTTNRVIHKPIRKDCNLEIVVGIGTSNNLQNQQLQQSQQQLLNNHHFNHHHRNKYKEIEMSKNRSGSNGSGPGPGDPLLAKQKHHHRRAFEYISKALKIDEENEGKFTKKFKLLLIILCSQKCGSNIIKIKF